MTIEEKRNRLLDYCHTVECEDCLLKIGGWTKTVLGHNCMIINDSPESDLDKALAIIDDKEAIENDNVNHPAHYTDGKIEVIDFIEDKKLGFHLGNAVKYIARAGKKDPTKYIEDLKKAIWYIERKIKEVEAI